MPTPVSILSESMEQALALVGEARDRREGPKAVVRLGHGFGRNDVVFARGTYVG